MKVPIDLLTSVTGWAGTAGAVFSINQHLDYIAEYLPGSLVIHVPANSMGKTITKSITPISVANCSEVVLSVWSRELKRVRTNTPADYFYKITFDGSHYYMMQTNLNFESDTFGINGWSTVDQITIIPTSDKEDWLIISGCYAVWDDLPLDVFQGMQLGLQNAVESLLPNGIPIGVVSCSAGAPFIAPSSIRYLARGAVVMLIDGVNSEKHQVDRFDEAAGSIWFTGLFDGRTTKYAHSNVSLALFVVVQYGVLESEAAIPGITIWGMATSDNQDTQDTLIVEDSMAPDGSGSLRRMPWMQNIKILVDCEARQSQVLAIVSRCARIFLASSRVWVNGRAHEMPYPKDGVYIEPSDAVVQIPKLQYEIDIEVHEERAQRVWVSPATGQTLTYTQSRGILGAVDP